MKRWLTVCLCFVVAAGFFSAVAAAELRPPHDSEREHRIFMVNSYHPEYFWSARQSQGIKDALEGFKIVSREYFMDTKRHPGAEWLAQQKEICLDKIAAFKPDLIFTGDDNATRTIATHFLGHSIPVVFYGVNAEPEIYGLVAEGQRQAPGSNVTGVLERHYFVPAVRKLKTLCYVNDKPISRLFLLSDDSYSSEKLFEIFKKEDNEFQLETIFLPLLSSFKSYKEKVAELNQPGNAVFIYSLETLKDESGRLVDCREILSWTRAHLNIPSIAALRKYLQEGVMYGLFLSGYNQAFYAGLKARQIFLGAPPATIPIDSPSQGLSGFNKTTMQQLGFKIPLDLLLGAEIFE